MDQGIWKSLDIQKLLKFLLMVLRDSPKTNNDTKCYSVECDFFKSNFQTVVGQICGLGGIRRDKEGPQKPRTAFQRITIVRPD